MTRIQGRPKQQRKLKKMKNRKTIFTATVLVLAFALAPIVHLAASDSAASPEDVQMPVITIHSTGDIPRGKTGSFVLHMQPALMYGGCYANFSVNGTAIQGVDYVPLVSPAYIGPSGYGVIQLQTLPDPRASSSRQAYSVVVTLEAGAGYALGEPRSAQIMIKP